MLQDFLNSHSISFEQDIKLSTKTWLRTGGIVNFWIIPDSIDKLIELIIHLQKNKIQYDIVGQTSNIYYLDSFDYSVIVSTLHLNRYFENEEYIECECGSLVSKISRENVKKGYKGYYGLVNLPGTVGAAIVNNSSCFNCAVSSLMLKAEVLMLETLEVKDFLPSEFSYSHHSSLFKTNQIGVILKVYLKKEIGNISDEIEKSNQVTMIRKTTQEPAAHTLGSVCNHLVPNNNFRLFAVRILLKLGKLFRIKNWTYKKLLLSFFGYRDLEAFISDKNLNTFIWLLDRDDLEEKFYRYKEFLSKVFKSYNFEIEVKDKKEHK